MKLSGTINGRRYTAFLDMRPDNPKAPNLKVYDTTDVPQDQKPVWQDCELATLWIEGVEEWLSGLLGAASDDDPPF